MPDYADCPVCGKAIKIPEGGAGHKIRCGGCNSKHRMHAETDGFSLQILEEAVPVKQPALVEVAPEEEQEILAEAHAAAGAASPAPRSKKAAVRSRHDRVRETRSKLHEGDDIEKLRRERALKRPGMVTMAAFCNFAAMLLSFVAAIMIWNVTIEDLMAQGLDAEKAEARDKAMGIIAGFQVCAGLVCALIACMLLSGMQMGRMMQFVFSGLFMAMTLYALTDGQNTGLDIGLMILYAIPILSMLSPEVVAWLEVKSAGSSRRAPKRRARTA